MGREERGMHKLAQIETFIKVVELKSYTNVAKKLNISAVAVGKQIQMLEKQLGMQLFNRTTRNMSLTEPGAVFYEYCQKILNNWQEAAAVMANLKKEPSGHLKIISTLYCGEHYLVPHLPEFVKKYPKIRLSVELADRIPNIEKEGIDILFAITALDYPNLIQRRIFNSRFVVCAAPAYLQKHGIPKQPKALLKHHYIAHSGRLQHAIIFNAEEKITPTPTIELNHSGAMLSCAIAGLGVVNLHHFIAEKALSEGKLIELLPDYPQETTPIYLYYQQSNFLLPKIKAFVDFIAAKCSV